VRTRDMRAMPEASPISLAEDLSFSVNVSRDGRSRVVQISGELDVATRNVVRRACLAGRRKAVVVEMADMTFMDCSGYGGLVAARRVLQAHGGSLTLRNQAGQPAELLNMIQRLELGA
jgi:anti-anti-sigma factor